jgi:N6-adenosine-specific RNA methylase IME4
MGKPDKYSVICADPAWAYKSARTLQGKNSHLTAKTGDQYKTEKSGDFKDLGPLIHNVVEDDSILFMWCTGPVMAEAIELMAAWEYPYSQVAFVWNKVNGNPGSYTHTNCEFVLVGRRNRIPRPYKRASARQYVESKRQGHSVKPEDIQDRIEKMFSMEDHRHLELFARRKREGWTCIGNELSGEDIRNDLRMLDHRLLRIWPFNTNDYSSQELLDIGDTDLIIEAARK